MDAKEEVKVVEEEKQPKKRKRRMRKYKVDVTTPTLNSSMQLEKSGPRAAASAATRSVIAHIPLQEPTRIWVRSNTKVHPYLVTRDYSNSKFKRFRIEKDLSVRSEEPKQPVKPE